MKLQKILKAVTVGLAAGICLTGNLHAAQIQGVTIANYSAQTNGPPVVDSVTNLVSSAGLFGDAHVNVPGGAMWYSGPGLPGTNFVTFNLGGVYTLNAMKVWNYNDVASAATANIGISNAVISYSTDGVNFTTNIPSQNFVRGQGLVNTFGLSFAQTITMPSPVTAQYVRINVKTNWAGNGTGVGLSKVRFISNTNPPVILSASQNYGSNQVTVIFGESVDVASATTLANYSISGSPAATITGVSMGEYTDRVVLQTSPLTGNNYSVVVSGVYDEALTATVTNNSTVPVKSEVFLWLKAGQGVSTISAFGGQMLTAWNDQSPYGHNAQPANLFNLYTNQPFLVNSVINGQPAITFSGTNVMQIPNDPANPINGDMTLFMVLEKTTTLTVGDPISKVGGFNGGNNSNVFAAPFDCKFDATGDGRPAFSFGNGSLSPATITSPTTITASTPLIAAFSVVGTNSGSITVNGVQYVVGNFTAAPVDGGNPIYLGVRGDGLTSSLGTTFSGYIAEVMLIRGTITPNDFSNINLYLSAKYSIALSRPVVAEQPASVTAQVGQQATFWVNATNRYWPNTFGNVPPNGTQPLGGGTFALPYSYQWQSNGVAISGATSAVYTTPNLTLSANGALYTVTVTSTLGAGSTNSTAATLTVLSDTTPPKVASAAKTANLTNILVVFSEGVDSGTGLNAANYSLNGGASVVSVAAGSSPNKVVLTTSTLNTNSGYQLTVQNVQDTSANAIVAASVPVMPAGMTLWLRSDSGIVTNPAAANPSLMVAWQDQSGNGNDAACYGVPVANRPTISFDGVNLAPAVAFVKANFQYMMVNNSPSVAISGDMSTFIVADFSSFNTVNALFSKDNNGSFGASYEVHTGGTGNNCQQVGRGTGWATGNSQAGNSSVRLNLNLPNAMTFVGGPGLASHQYINGVLSYNSPYSSAFCDSGAPILIGGRPDFNAVTPMSGNIQEIMLFTNAISAGDQTNVDNYLGGKYFTVTVTTPLTNTPALAGSTATFSVVASQGPAHLAFQWQEIPATNSLITNNIAGATSSTYTTPLLNTSDNGDKFQVLVIGGTSTNVIGLTLNGSPATLTVVSVPPVVQIYGTAIWGTNILAVTFQTPLNPSMATNTANYSLTNNLNQSATVLSATLVSPTEVILTTSPLAAGTSYTLTVRNLQDQYGSIMTTTNLVNSTASYPPVALWLRADKGITAQNGDPVAEWDDQSGNGNNFGGDGGFEPTFVTNAVNGLPALLFNGTNGTYLYAGSSPSLALVGDITIFAVMNFTTYANTNGLFAAGGGGEIISKNDPANKNIGASYDYTVYYGSQTPYFLRGNGTISQTPFQGAPTSPSTGVWHEMSAMSQGNLEWHRLDGSTNGGAITWSVAGGPADTGGLVILGERTDGAVRLTGQMAELIVASSAMSASDQAAMETYLGTKYGLITLPGLLGISATNGTAQVSWQNPQWSYVLQSTPSLNPTAWTAVTNVPVLINNTNVVSIPMGTNQTFYRLQSQSQ